MVDETKFHEYNPSIEMIWATPEPQQLILLAANMTMYKDPYHMKKPGHKFFVRLLSMNHTSLFEHVTYTFLIKDVSRSLLAQITRHRISSFTASSQHYQHYDDYGFCISKKWKDDVFVLQAVDEAMTNYKMLIKAGCPKEEARQVLPGGMKVNILWTINARSLTNFLNLRLCRRNVEEIRLVAKKVHGLVKDHFPELFCFVGQDCYMTSCRQGVMRCKEKK